MESTRYLGQTRNVAISFNTSVNDVVTQLFSFLLLLEIPSSLERQALLPYYADYGESLVNSYRNAAWANLESELLRDSSFLSPLKSTIAIH